MFNTLSVEAGGTFRLRDISRLNRVGKIIIEKNNKDRPLIVLS